MEYTATESVVALLTLLFIASLGGNITYISYKVMCWISKPITVEEHAPKSILERYENVAFEATAEKYRMLIELTNERYKILQEKSDLADSLLTLIDELIAEDRHWNKSTINKLQEIVRGLRNNYGKH